MPRHPVKTRAVADTLAARIVDGAWAPGTFLPSLRSLADQTGSDKDTVTRALKLLEHEYGLVDVLPGEGAKVRTRLHRPASTMSRGFTAAMENAGLEHYIHVLRVGEVPAPVSAAHLLGVPAGTMVLERARVRGQKDGDAEIPYELSKTHILLSVARKVPALAAENTGDGGINARLGEAGYQLRFSDEVNARMPTEEESETLEIPRGHPILEIVRRTYDQRDGGVIKVSRTAMNPERVRLTLAY